MLAVVGTHGGGNHSAQLADGKPTALDSKPLARRCGKACWIGVVALYGIPPFPLTSLYAVTKRVEPPERASRSLAETSHRTGPGVRMMLLRRGRCWCRECRRDATGAMKPSQESMTRNSGRMLHKKA
jgi:hypothetical protein